MKNKSISEMDYRQYSLNKLEEWLHDCMSSGEASPQEVYDTIVNVVKEQYNYYKNGASKTDKLLQLLNGHKPSEIDTSYFYGGGADSIQFNVDPAGNEVSFDNINSQYHGYCEAGDTSNYCNNSWNSFWEDDGIKEDKVIKWMLPVEQDLGSDDYYVTFPDDLLEAADLKEGDQVEWVDNGNGSYTLRKVNAI